MTEKPDNRYNHKKIEERWQQTWEEGGAFTTRPDAKGEKYYCLEMFPYPSGKIHMGHVRNYSIGDVIARFLTMRGRNVLHPMGWDSFGLPAENAAIQNGTHPAAWTHANIANMKAQLKRMGLSYDWSREVATCKQDYYRWNQWIFLKLFEKGLAYKRRSTVNWCPDCVTVLANEQVEDGLCWRCSSNVETKELEQWFLKITAYAEELLQFTDKLPGWPERVLTMQRNWIGKSVGAEVTFKVDGRGDAIRIFTTRPDTIYGVTFMSLAATHPILAKITTTDRRAEVEAFTNRVRGEAKTTREIDTMKKEGVFTGAYCINPLTGDKVPVYAANFVLMEYGTGAVMAVPGHDQRDFEFAKAYGLPVKVVIIPPQPPLFQSGGDKGGDAALDAASMTEAYVDDGVMVNSDKFTGMTNTEAKAAIITLLEERGAGTKTVNFKLRDWGISRQRYWGCPIPIIYCNDCGPVAAPLPVVLPEDIKLTGKGLSPLATSQEFTHVDCPKCGKPGRREVDTMDTFVDSSWYFLRYCSPNSDTTPYETKDAHYWMPVDQYIGGIEHAVMHLLYARFFTKALRDLGLHTFDEPFKNLLTQGMVCKETRRCPEHGFIYPEDVKDGKCGICGAQTPTGPVEKMSKSKKNVIDPDGIINAYGADTTRLFSLFAAPPEKDLDWSEDGVEGAYRFLNRVWRLVMVNIDELKKVKAFSSTSGVALEGAQLELHRLTHKTIKKVTQDIEERFHFNTAISAIMELVNEIYKVEGWQLVEKPPDSGKIAIALNNISLIKVIREAVEAVVLLLSPFAPHISEELWQRLGNTTPVYKTSWPLADAAALVNNEALVVIQINGKLRSKITVPVGATEEAVKEAVMNDAKVIEWTSGKTLLKFVYVPNKIVNMVVG
ncbi:MAG: leucine--tRNA ligase [Deltaproteobacteria bacterium RIFCSPLOWO2_02_FULL_53_8]|nr:MAG: leucine--tRNA ligase [Deltaproteobacteria bacterium RIFCSPLOWO2_02_FULL_53_8]